MESEEKTTSETLSIEWVLYENYCKSNNQKEETCNVTREWHKMANQNKEDERKLKF